MLNSAVFFSIRPVLSPRPNTFHRLATVLYARSNSLSRTNNIHELHYRMLMGQISLKDTTHSPFSSIGFGNFVTYLAAVLLGKIFMDAFDGSVR